MSEDKVDISVDSKLNDQLNQWIMKEQWDKAEDFLLGALETAPDDHWLITQLSLVKHEQLEYETALSYSEQAIALAPDCPLVLADYGRNLYANDRYEQAIETFQRLASKSPAEMAKDECGEGIRFSKYLIHDSIAWMAKCHEMLGNDDKAREMYVKHLELRTRGIFSNFTKKEIQRKLKQLSEE